MTKTEAKALALATMMESVGTAYYKIVDDESIPQDEQDMVCNYINEYGERIAKALKTQYVTY